MKARTTTFKASAAVCAVLAGTLGFGSLASAATWRENLPYYREPVPQDQRHDHRRDRHDDRRDWRGDNRQHDNWNRSHRAARFQRGGYLPHEYRNRAYYVNDWRAYNGLYAPPRGHQWVNVGGELLLVALATGLIANALVY